MKILKKQQTKMQNKQTQNKKPLEHIKVIDLTRILSGPFCTMLLNDLGAEIIKIEKPNTGDDSRQFGPFINNKSAYFISLNRGKKSITLNLKLEKDKEIFKQLISKADVLIENFKPGTMKRLGLDYETLKNINSKLIYASISGFGQTGPLSNNPAYDIIAQAYSGLMSLTGEENRNPVRVGVSIGDISAALFTTIGIISALYNRHKTGRGEKIDVSMIDSLIAISENAVARYSITNKIPKPLGTRHPSITPFQAYKTKDDRIIIAVGNDILWEKFCLSINKPELINDIRFNSNEKRTKNIEQLNKILEETIKNKATSEWLDIFKNNNIPSTRINTIKDVMYDKHILFRNMILNIDYKELEKLKITGNPIKMSSIKEQAKHSKAPELGEHNEEIIDELKNDK